MDHYFMCWLSEKPVHPSRSFLPSSSNSLSRLWALIAVLLFSKYQMRSNCSQKGADMWVLLQGKLVAQISILGISHACTHSVSSLGGWRLLSCLSAVGNAPGMLLNPRVRMHLLWSQLWDTCMGQCLGLGLNCKIFNQRGYSSAENDYFPTEVLWQQSGCVM